VTRKSICRIITDGEGKKGRQRMSENKTSDKKNKTRGKKFKTSDDGKQDK